MSILTNWNEMLNPPQKEQIHFLRSYKKGQF